jgi:hypothetical protein
MTQLGTFSTIALLSASTAMAQGVDYLSYGGNYTRFSGGGASASVYSFRGAVEYRMKDAFINGAFGISETTDEFDDASRSSIRVTGGYFIMPELAVYGSINKLDNGNNDPTSYNLGVEYTFGPATAGLNYSDSSDGRVSGSASVYLGYQVTDALEAGIIYSDNDGASDTALTIDYGDGALDVDAIFDAFDDGQNLLGVDASYALGNGLRITGAYLEVDEYTKTMTVGGGYEVSENTWLDFAYGKSDFDDAVDLDVLSVALTFETGRETLLANRVQTTTITGSGIFAELGGL